MSKKAVLTTSVAIVAAFVCSAVILPLLGPNNFASAESATMASILQKAEINGMQSCYKSNGLIKKIDKNSVKADEIINSSSSLKRIMPGYITNAQKNDGLYANCKEMLFGGTLNNSSVGRFSGLYNIQSAYSPADFGYQPAQGSDKYDTVCFQATFTLAIQAGASADGVKSGTICLPVSNGTVVGDAIKTQSESSPASGQNYYGFNSINIRYLGQDEGTPQHGVYVTSVPTFNGNAQDMIVCADHNQDNYSCSTSVNNFKQLIKNALSESGSISDVSVNEVRNTGSSSNAASSYEIVNPDASALAALKHITNNQNAKFSDYAFTPTDWAVLYKTYYDAITDKHPDAVTVHINKCSENKNQYTYAITEDGGKTWCELDSSSVNNVDEKFAVRDNDTKLKLGNFGDVIKGLMSLDYSKVDASAVPGDDNPQNSGDGSEGDGNSEQPACYEAAGALGWIMCTVIQGVGNTITGIYDLVVEPFLRIDASMFNREDGGVYDGWKTFRNYSNIVFAIIFLVVILAQVTGIGISNYNIKKILPRLVMIVILVNVSFVICQLAVDLSNILGYSLREMFVRFAENITFEGSNGGDITTGTIVDAFILALGLGGGAMGTYAIFTGLLASITWSHWIFVVLIGLIGVLASLFTFFIILALRQAGVILLAVVAPLAIVCYALPNTKNLFDKWLKFFKGLLLVYPICGLMLGGGQFASALLLKAGTSGDSSAGFFYCLVAMLISVVPFFYIPTVLKGSMKLMGDIGNKIANRGSMYGGMLQKRASNSKIVQERNQEYNRNLNMRRDSRLMSKYDKQRKKIEGRIARGVESGELRGSSLARQERRLSRANYRLAQATGRNDRAMREEAFAAASAGRGQLAPGSPRFTAMVQGIKDRSLEEESRGYETIWRNDGSSGDLDKMEANLSSALNDLSVDANNQDARARFTAAIHSMDKIDLGRQHIENAFGKSISTLGAGPNAEKSNAGLTWAANTLMDHNGKEIKDTSPTLHSTLDTLAKGRDGDIKTMSGEMVKVVNKDGEFLTRRSAGALKAGIGSLSGNKLIGSDDRELDKFVDGMRSGSFQDSDAQTLTRSAIEGLSNPNSRSGLKSSVGNKLQNIAVDGLNSSTIGNVKSEALNYMADSIKNNSMDQEHKDKLVSMAQEAFTSGNYGDNAAALNKILSAADQQTFDVGFNTSGGVTESESILVPRDNQQQSSTPIQSTTPQPTAPTPSNPPAPSQMPSMDAPVIETINPDGSANVSAGSMHFDRTTTSQGGVVLPNESASRPGRPAFTDAERREVQAAARRKNKKS